MLISSIRQALAALLVAVLVSACGGGTSAAPPVGGITVTPGDGRATVSWAMEPNVQYWVFYAPVSTKFPTISTTDWVSIPGAQAIINVQSPYVASGLVNGTAYSFTVNARKGDGPGGPGTVAVNASPRPAGAVWANSDPAGSNTLRTLAYGVGADSLGYYLAMGDNGNAYKSRTGLTWTALAAAGTRQINSSTYAFTRFIAVGDGGGLFTTTDFSSWSTGVSNTTENLNSVASTASLAVAVGNKGTIRTSNDGVNWTAVGKVPTSQDLYGVAYSSSGLWVAVGAGGTILTSSDASTWALKTSGTTANLRAVAVQPISGYNVVAVGDAGAAVLSADNGATWTVQSTGLSGDLLAVSPSSGQWLAVGAGGLVAISTDGKVWTTSTSGTSANLYAVLAGLGQYVAVGARGVNINSQ